MKRRLLVSLGLLTLSVVLAQEAPEQSPAQPPAKTGKPATTDWPGVAYTEVRAYLYNPLTVENGIIRDGNLNPEVVNPEGTKLDAVQVTQLLKASYDQPPDRSGSGCFLPHHGIVFYDHEGKAVANLSICFICSKAASQPYKESLKWDMTGLSKLITDLGLPVFGQLEEAEAHFIGLARKWPDAKVESAVDDYLFPTEGRDHSLGEFFRLQLLQGLGERTHPLLNAYLSDETLRAEILKIPSSGVFPRSAFYRLCEAFGDSPPATAIPLLAPFSGMSDPSVRRTAFETIARTGAPEIIPYIRQAFADSGYDVTICALGGLQVAIDRGVMHSDTKTQLFPDVKALADEVRSEDWAKALVGLDPDKAVELFLSPEIFTAESPLLGTILDTLCKMSLQLPRDRLHALITELKAAKLDRDKQRIARPALLLLGRQRHPDDLHLLSGAGDDVLASCAMQGLLAWHGIEEYRDRLSKQEKEKGYATLNEAQRLLFAAEKFADNTLGIADYFSGDGGDHWRDALAGLEQMNRMEVAVILEEAVALFGEKGPDNDPKVRRQQVATIAEKSGFLDLDQRLKKTNDIWDLSPDRFAIEHAGSFK